MKPTSIIVEALVKIGLGILVTNLAIDMGKAYMFSAVKEMNPGAADDIMNALEYGVNCDEIKGHTKCRLKIVRYMCRAFTAD